MALVKCPECNNEISDKAIACPHCGYPINMPEKEDRRPVAPIYPFILVILSFIILFYLGRFGGTPILVIIGITIVPVVFSLIKSVRCVKEKHRRWGWCLATEIMSIFFIVLYAYMWIAAIYRWTR